MTCWCLKHQLYIFFLNIVHIFPVTKILAIELFSTQFLLKNYFLPICVSMPTEWQEREGQRLSLALFMLILTFLLAKDNPSSFPQFFLLQTSGQMFRELLESLCSLLLTQPQWHQDYRYLLSYSMLLEGSSLGSDAEGASAQPLLQLFSCLHGDFD